jgi:hypothetical protein
MSLLGGVTAELGELKVRLTADTAKLASQLKNATTQMEKYRNTAAKVALASGAAFAGLTLGIKKLVDITTKQQAAERKLAVAVKATGQAISVERVKEYASALQEVTTFGDEVTIESAALLATFNVTEEQLMGLIPVAQDMASMFGVAMPQAAKTLGRTLAQGAGALTEYGIALTKAQIESFNLADKSGRVAKLVEIFAGIAGGAAKQQALSFGGALDQLNNAFGDTLEQLGAIAAIGLAPLFRILKTSFEAITDVLDRLNPELKSFLSIVGTVATAVLGLTAAISALAAAKLALGLAALKLAPVIIPLLPILGGITAALLVSVTAIGAVRKAWKADLGGIQGHVKTLKNQVVNAFSAIRFAVLSALDWITEKLVRTFTFWKEMFGNLKTLLKGSFSEMKGLTDIAAEADKTLADMRKAGGGGPGALTKTALNQLVAPMLKTAEKFGEGFKKGSGFIIDAFKEGSSLIGDAGKELVGSIVDMITVEKQEAVEATGRGVAAPTGVAVKRPGSLGELVSSQLESLLGGLGVAGQRLSDASVAAADMIVSVMAQHAPILSQTMEAAVKGFAAAGPVGALVGAILSLVLRLKPIIELLKIFESIIGGIIDVLNEAFKPVTDILMLIGRALQTAFKAITTVVSMLNKVSGAGLINNILGKFIPDTVKDIASSLDEANKILQGTVADLSRVLGRETQTFITEAPLENLREMLTFGGPELREEVRKELQARLDAAVLSQQVADVQSRLAREQVAEAQKRFDEAVASGTVTDEAIASLGLAVGFASMIAQGFADTADEMTDTVTNLHDALGSLDEQTEMLAENMEAANEELLNVPTGFKIALSRFRAIEGEAMTAPSIGFGDKPQTALGSTIAPDLEARGMNIEVVNIGSIQAENARQVLESIKDEAEWESNVMEGITKKTQSMVSAVFSALPFVP